MMEYIIRKMKRREMDIAIGWAAKEGWNPGIYDAECFYQTDSNGFLMGFLDNKPVSLISAVSYGDDSGFLGFYIVKPEYRSKGFGMRIKSGFKLAYRNIRFEGRASRNKTADSVKTVPVSKIPSEQLEQYDRKMFSTSRAKFLRSWISQPQSLTVGILEESNLKGYGMIRKCHIGYKVGPLFADNEKYADVIFCKLMAFVRFNEPVFLDVPEPNREGIKLANRYGMKPVFETARMYTKNPPAIDLNKIFGVTSFELG